MSAKTVKGEPGYGIGAVAKLTGLTDHTIRVWERRYEAVVASRSASGRRIYSAADVEKLGLLKALTDKGIPISQIAASGVEELRQQAGSVEALRSTQVPDTIRVAVLGDFLPGALRDGRKDLAPLDIVIADSSRERFLADLRRQEVDAIVYETPTLSGNTIGELSDMMAVCGARSGILVYTFGRSSDADLVRRGGNVVLRAPVTVDDICAAVGRSFTPETTLAARPQTIDADEASADWRFTGKAAPRRFTQQQLASLANISSTIECECPQHLAQLVSDLSAFEVYSAQCANRDDEDAALHRYLHQTTAEARALIEVALQKVAEAEGISV